MLTQRTPQLTFWGSQPISGLLVELVGLWLNPSTRHCDVSLRESGLFRPSQFGLSPGSLGPVLGVGDFNVCTKANRTLGFLRRNLYSCPPDVPKEAAYKAVLALVDVLGVFTT